MAKKQPATKKAAKRTSKKAASSTTAKKSASKKTAVKKAASKKATSKKAGSKAASSKKTPVKRVAVAKTTSKSPSKAPTKKPTTKKPTTKKAETKKAPASKPSAADKAAKKTTKKAATASKVTASSKKAPAKAASAAETKAAAANPKADGKPARKGITIVENRSRKKKAESKFKPPPSTLGTILNKRKRQPLIPSGPNAPTSEFSKFGEDGDANSPGKKVKSPFKKKELDAFREILLRKRRELAGDVEEMERSMASLGDRGGNPALDVAEQGSDAYDQSLSIGLAEADRKLIREIDEAVRRIEEGVYGVCEVTHEPISTKRLNELPWTRLSIEAARDEERRGGGR